MRRASRLPIAVVVCAGIFTPGWLIGAGCTDAVGIEQCRAIETARCQSAQKCGFSEDEALRCSEFYHDQCLHGIENAGEPPDDTQADACIKAIEAVAACAGRGAASMQDCPEAPLVPAAPGTLAPCTILLKDAHLLAACAFVSKADAGTPPPPDGGSGGGGSGGGGSADAAGE